MNWIKKYICKQEIGVLAQKIAIIKFEAIGLSKLDCFHSNDLYFFEQIGTYGLSGNEIIDQIKQLFTKNKINAKEFDFRQLSSISASKSLAWGFSYPTVEIFGAMCLHKYNSNWTLESCTKGIVDRFKNRQEEVLHFTWNNRYHWLNEDKSHHMASGISLAINQNQPFIFNANIKEISINKTIASALMSNFAIFLMSTNCANAIQRLFENIKIYKNGIPIKLCMALDCKDKLSIILIRKQDDGEIQDVINILNNLSGDKILDINKKLQAFL